MDHFKAIRRKFEDAGIRLHAYNLSFNDGFSDEEIDRGFEMAKALGVEIITASSTLSAAKRVAPFADKHKMIVAMHGHDNVSDPNQFAKPESFAQAMALKSGSASSIARTRSWLPEPCPAATGGSGCTIEIGSNPSSVSPDPEAPWNLRRARRARR